MTAFPETPTPSEPFTYAPRFNTIVAGPYNSGSKVFRKGWVFPQHVFTLKWGYPSLADALSLYNFFVSMGGKFGAFTLFDFRGADASPIGRAWTGVYLGTGNGSTTTLDLPFKNGTSVTVYQNGTPKAGTVLTGGGADGRDRFTPTTAWTLGALLTVSFTGQRAFSPCHFAADEMSFDEFSAAMSSTGIGIEETR